VPQSQSSPLSCLPLPQTALVQAWPAVGQVAPGSSWQVLEQPSPLVVLPSSQVSLPTMIVPSPHFGEHRFPGTRHSKPLSTLQVLEQPSPLVVLPSSQVSLPSSTPSRT